MTAVAAPGDGPLPALTRRPRSGQLLTAVRLQLLVWPWSVAFSWTILGLSFGVNLAVWASIGDEALAEAWTGGLVSLYAVTFTSYVTSMAQVFPLLVGLGLTRRIFYRAMSLLALVQAAVYAVLLELLGAAEVATDGWGAGLAFFRPGPLHDLSSPGRLVLYGVPFLLLAHVGIVVGVTHRRWGSNGIYLLLVGVISLLAAVVLLLAVTDAFGAVGDRLGGASLLQVLALWPLPLIGALALAGRIGIARAAP